MTTATDKAPLPLTNEKKMADAIRALAMDAVEQANSGHPGMPMGMADVATILFKEFLQFDPKNPSWPDRDRFILSAGHGSMLLYALLYLTGYEDITIDNIKNFRQFGSHTDGHPEYGHLKGIETTTGPLGQGLANAVGFALAEKMLQQRFGKEIVNHHTYVIAGDGCLMEGISHEAISLAGHLGLNKLVVLFDDNKISIDGPTNLAVSDDQIARFKASNWNTISIDGHDYNQIRKALQAAKQANKPSLIACRTTIGYGAPKKAGSASAHGAPLGKEEIIGARKNLDWDAPPFVVPDTILQSWRQIGEKGNKAHKNWLDKFNALDKKTKDDFSRSQEGKLPDLGAIITNIKNEFIKTEAGHATRKSSGIVLETLTTHIPELIGGSADLTGSNLTKTSALTPITKDNFAGRYIYYGVREHAMAAIMNGLALHKGFIPYGGTFLVFSDYCRPAIRLAALMQQRVIFVMTHDSIGLGEDGPTHQPIEHLASLRAIPNLNVFRPADAIETAECWQLALEDKNTPSLLALTRQNTPLLRKEKDTENKCALGAYTIAKVKEGLTEQVTIFASGSEVAIAIKAKETLEQQDIGTKVISVPSMEKFAKQSSEYKISLLCTNSIKVAVEAACRMPWEKFIGPHGIFIGMEGFGASAPAEQLYEHFGITAQNIVNKVNEKLARQKAK